MEVGSSEDTSGSSDYEFLALHDALLRGNRDKVQRILSVKRLKADCSRISRASYLKMPLSRVKRRKRLNGTKHSLLRVQTCLEASKIHPLVEMLLSDIDQETRVGDRDNYTSTLRFHLAKEPELVNARWKGLTLLHLTSFRGRSDDVTTLLAYGADANSVVDTTGWETETQGLQDQRDCMITLDKMIKDECLTPIMLAAAEGHLKTVSLLVKKGARTESGGVESGLDIKTPLFYGVENSLFDLVQLLINCGARVDAREQCDQRTLLHVVRDADMARQLIDRGLNVNANDEKGFTPLHCAVGRHDIKVAQVLLEYNADINAEDAYGETPLYHALNGRCTTELIQFLIGQGSRIKHKTKTDSRTPLHEAIVSVSCSFDVIQLLIDSGSDINAADADGRTPLHIAIEVVENFSYDVVNLLIDNGANVKTVDRFGQLPLHLACQRGDLGTVRLLLDRGSDVNAATMLGMLPLHCATHYGSTETVKLLLQRGSKVNRLALNWKEEGSARSQLISALFIAVSQKNYEALKILLESGTDVNLRDEFGATVLHYAVEIGWIEGTNLLLERKADPNVIGGFHRRTALHVAAKRKSLEAMELLVRHGADVNAIDHDGATALHYAARMGAVEIVEFLLESGANVKAFTDSTWSTPLHLAATVNSPKVLRLLLSHGAEFQAADGRNKTALDLAAQFGLEDNARLLLKSSYDVGVQAELVSLCPLHFAARHSSSNILTMLIRQGYSVNATDENGKTPLHCAAEYGCEANVRLLLAQGSGVNAVSTCSHSTPLHLIARKNCPRTLKLMVESGANVTAVDGEGNTPLHCAVDSGPVANVRLLIENGGDNNWKNHYGLTPLDLAISRDRRSMEAEFMLQQARKKKIFPLTWEWVASALACCKV